MTIELCIFFVLFALFIGYIWGASKQGKMTDKTNDLPRCLFRVIQSDSACTTLREIGLQKRNYLITTEAFGGIKVRPGFKVRVTTGPKEMKELGIENLGYPPLVIDCSVE